MRVQLPEQDKVERDSMKRIERLAFIGLIIALLLIGNAFAYGQEETETPVPDPVVVTEPVETVSNPLDVLIGLLDAVQTFIAGVILVFIPKLIAILKQLKEALDIFNVQNARNP